MERGDGDAMSDASELKLEEREKEAKCKDRNKRGWIGWAHFAPFRTAQGTGAPVASERGRARRGRANSKRVGA